MEVVIIVIVVVVVIGAIIAGLYNSLVRLNQRADEGWSDITVQLNDARI